MLAARLRKRKKKSQLDFTTYLHYVEPEKKNLSNLGLLLKVPLQNECRKQMSKKVRYP